MKSNTIEGRSRFICAFRGKRDDYQVPISLYEISLLECLITDFYTPSFLFNVGMKKSKLIRRYSSLLPSSKVVNQPFDILKSKFYKLIGYHSSVAYKILDKDFSLRAAEMASKSKSDLFLYTPYAWEAFTHKYSHKPQKILFQYHPHGALEREILSEDIRKHPEYEFNINDLPDSGLNLSSLDRKRYEEVWKFSDKILCASSFTKNSLIKAGATPDKCFVVPYGVDVAHATLEDTLFDEFTFLFVGSGVQRKGLHILIKAWEHSNLSETGRLLIISRDIEESIKARVPKDKNIIVRNDVSDDELKSLYTRSHLFVLPSLVEGFGQVFLEALAQGCPVLGTFNTCLPDLGSEKDGIFIVQAGDYLALSDKLKYLRNFLSSNNLRNIAFETAKRNTWTGFRRRIQSIVLN